MTESAPAPSLDGSRELSQRLMTAGVLVVGFALLELLAATTCVGKVLLLLVGFCTIVLAAIEVRRLILSCSDSVLTSGLIVGGSVLPATAVVVTALVFGTCGVAPPSGGLDLLSGLFFGSTLSVIALLVAGRSDLRHFERVLLPACGALVLLGLGGGALLLLAAHPGGAYEVLWLVSVIATADSAAYFCGKRWGSTKLFPAISPGKSLEGYLGAFLGGATVGTALAPWLLGFSSLLGGLALSLFVVVGGAAGDLLKSTMKRRAGCKESGNLLPGHGGILDRIDGILGAAPLLAALLRLL